MARVYSKQYDLTCSFCDQAFVGWSSSCLYCSPRCRKNAQARRRYNRTRERNLCVWCFTTPAIDGYSLCADCRERGRDYRYNMAPEQKRRATEKTKAWIKTQPDYWKRTQQKTHDKLRRQVYAHYGERCACCGVSDWRFLTIDHINNDGAAHRRKLGKPNSGGVNFYRWLRTHNFPDGFQVLCFNCNCAKSRFGGICPHQLDKGNPEIVALPSVNDLVPCPPHTPRAAVKLLSALDGVHHRPMLF